MTKFKSKSKIWTLLPQVSREFHLPGVSVLLVLVAVGFNFFTLLPELSIKADPNDNIFQFSLVQQMNEVWQEVAAGRESPLALLDHWVPNWASGYPLPYYYQHLPHLGIVAIYNFLFKKISLYTIFNWLKFLAWVFFPLSLYLSGRWFGFARITAGLMAFFGSQILTDGLYGADISSFVWRGYGLSTQLLAVFFAPLALSAFYRLFKKAYDPGSKEIPDPGSIKTRDYLVAILLLSATFASHLAIGYMVVLSAVFIPIALSANWSCLFKDYLKLFFLFAICFLLLSYWFVPLLLGNTYHNISFWDSPLKWNSYGANQVITMFLQGALYDFNRFPILTALIILGWFVCLYQLKNQYRLLALVFPFWLCLYFGRTTWGPLLDFLPMMKEMHLQRLLNGLHLVSFPLMGIGASFLFKKVKSPLILLGLVILMAIPVYKANANYLHFNRIWLKQANKEYQKEEADLGKLVATIKSLPPGRVYAGTPGNWGKDFKIGATQVYLALSTAGLPLNGFLPESWSLNSDPEPFFSPEKLGNYLLYNVRYLVTPKDLPLPNFAKPLQTFGQLKLSQIQTSGYFDIGTSNLLVKTEKTNILNIIHLWLLSPLPEKKEFPTLLLTGKEPKDNFLPPPLSYPISFKTDSQSKILAEQVSKKNYGAQIEIGPNCQNCLVVFKMTYHPNWQVKLNNTPTEKIMVFPSFMAVKAPPGNNQISFEYRPSPRKLPLLLIGIASLGFLPLFKKYYYR